jgi:hypothetical protein
MRSLWVVACSSALFVSSAAPAGDDARNPVPAVWKEQRLQFFYMGRTSRYSCEGLRDKMRAMLLELGARRDLRITPLGCDDDAPRPRLKSMGPNLELVFSSPALPDATLRPLRRGDLAAVDARFEAFTITRDAFRNMDIGDCELVEEFVHQILRKLATRDVKEDITCVPEQQSGSRFFVRGEVLKGVSGPSN